MSKNLKFFFEPKNIAVIGASENPKKVGGIIMKKSENFSGKIVPVNIKKEIILGKNSYSSVNDYSGKIDLAVIATPAVTVKKILNECGKKKIKNIIVISAGFSEVGNLESEQDIIRTAQKNNINLLGPNCFGVANPYKNLDLTFSNSSPRKGKIAFVSQSGALWSYISDFREIGFSGFASLGNMADLDFIDFIEYFGKDKRTQKIILYVEKLNEGKKFIEVCRKIKKEIVVVKAGKTKKGSEAAISHTGSLATEFEIYRGVFNQAGVKLVDSLASAIGKKREIILSKLKGKKIAIITNAGGAGALMTDYIEEAGFSVLSSVDLLGTALASDYEMELNHLKYKNYDSVVVILTPQSMSEPEKTAEIIANSKIKNKIIACFLGEKSISGANKILKKNKIPVFNQSC
jgi:acetyltransferase